MSELLLELFSEEIPARMQARAAEDLRRLVVDGLKAQGLDDGRGARLCDAAAAGAGGRRACRPKSPAVSEERKGPRVGAPEQAIAGLPQGRRPRSRSTRRRSSRTTRRATSTSRASSKPGRPAAEIVAEVVRGDDREVSRGRSRCAGAAGTLRVGAAAAFDRAACSTARSCRSRSPASRRGNDHARPSLPRQRAVQGDELRGLRKQARSSTRCCSIRRRARRDDRRAGARARQGGTSSSWSRTRRCSPRTPASPSGRRC